MTEGAQPRRMSAAEIFQASQDGGNKVGSMKKKQDNGITGVLAIEESGAKVESLGGRRVLGESVWSFLDPWLRLRFRDHKHTAVGL